MADRLPGQLLTRYAETVAGHRNPARLRRYFEMVALSTARQPEHKTLYVAAGVNRKTALAYDALLTRGRDTAGAVLHTKSVSTRRQDHRTPNLHAFGVDACHPPIS